MKKIYSYIPPAPTHTEYWAIAPMYTHIGEATNVKIIDGSNGTFVEQSDLDGSSHWSGNQLATYERYASELLASEKFSHVICAFQNPSERHTSLYRLTSVAYNFHFVYKWNTSEIQDVADLDKLGMKTYHPDMRYNVTGMSRESGGTEMNVKKILTLDEATSTLLDYITTYNAVTVVGYRTTKSPDNWEETITCVEHVIEDKKRS